MNKNTPYFAGFIYRLSIRILCIACLLASSIAQARDPNQRSPYLFPTGIFHIKTAPEIPDYLRESLLQISQKIGSVAIVVDGEAIAHANGVAVEPGNRIFLNKHVLDEARAQNATVTIQFGNQYYDIDLPKDGFFCLGDLDLCLVDLKKGQVHSNYFLESEIGLGNDHESGLGFGEPIAIVGYLDDFFGKNTLDPVVSLGHVGRNVPFEKSHSRFHTSAVALEGLSGSPVLFVKKDGSIGNAFAVLTGFSGIAPLDDKEFTQGEYGIHASNAIFTQANMLLRELRTQMLSSIDQAGQNQINYNTIDFDASFFTDYFLSGTIMQHLLRFDVMQRETITPTGKKILYEQAFAQHPAKALPLFASPDVEKSFLGYGLQKRATDDHRNLYQLQQKLSKSPLLGWINSSQSLPAFSHDPTLTLEKAKQWIESQINAPMLGRLITMTETPLPPLFDLPTADINKAFMDEESAKAYIYGVYMHIYKLLDDGKGFGNGTLAGAYQSYREKIKNFSSPEAFERLIQSSKAQRSFFETDDFINNYMFFRSARADFLSLPPAKKK